MIKAVIFDLDDTLISEEEYVKSGFCVVSDVIAKKYNLSAESVYETLKKHSDNDSKTVFNDTLDEFAIRYAVDDIKELINVYRDHFPDICFYSDVIPVIERLKKSGINTGIITDGYQNVQSQKIKRLEAEKIFDYVIITDKLGREYWKPNIKAFELIKEQFGIEYSEMMYVGDNPNKDFAMKREIPITTVRILRDGMYKECKYLYGIKEDFSISSLAELDSVIDMKKR